jgi:hypothetical protein
VDRDSAGWTIDVPRAAPTERTPAEVPGELRRVASGTIPLMDAFLTIARFREEQARVAADLLDREVWALTALLRASEPMWDGLGAPTLHFQIDHIEPETDSHLELGHFAHLATLRNPSPQEQALAMSTTVSWARVYAHHEREAAGESGAMACSYVPLSVADAVAILNFSTIIQELEAATRTVGGMLLRQAQSQQMREARLLGVERMVGWEPTSTGLQTDEDHTRRSYVLRVLLGTDRATQWMRGISYLGLVGAVVFVLIGVPYMAAALVVAGLCLLIWPSGEATPPPDPRITSPSDTSRRDTDAG